MTWALRSLCWPSRRAHLLTTRKWRWHCLRQSCALRGRYAGRPFPAQYGQASRRHRRLVHRAELRRCTGGLGAFGHQQAAPGIYRCIACHYRNVQKQGLNIAHIGAILSNLTLINRVGYNEIIKGRGSIERPRLDERRT